MGSAKFSITYQTSARDRPLSSIRVRAAAGEPCRIASIDKIEAPPPGSRQ
jgi:hypothetical protein